MLPWPSEEAESAFDDVLLAVKNHERKVPVPRRMIRLIAGGARRAVIATALGYLLRCLYYRGGECVPTGRCKASWIADVFAVDLRNVKSARQHLIQIGWLLPKSVPQRSLNRYGAEMEVSLTWAWPSGGRKSDSPPPKSLPTTKSPPPYKNNQLSLRSKNQKPGNGPSGVFKEGGRGRVPRMAHVVPADLRDVRRLEALRRGAYAKGYITGSECDRLRFFGAAEHALAIGTKNPSGLFVTMVRRGLWKFITQDDEDAARRRLRQLDGADGTVAAASMSDGAGERHSERLISDEMADRMTIREMVLRSLGLGDQAVGACATASL